MRFLTESSKAVTSLSTRRIFSSSRSMEKHFTIERDEEKIRRVERLVTAFEDSVRNRIRNHEMAAYKDSLAHRLFREAQEIRKQVDNPNSK